METIYRRYNIGSPSFIDTLDLIEDLITARMLPNIRRINVSGCNSGRPRLVFTIFEDGRQYRMVFLDANIRQFRPGENLNEEIVLMETFMETLRTGVLHDIIP